MIGNKSLGPITTPASSLDGTTPQALAAPETKAGATSFANFVDDDDAQDRRDKTSTKKAAGKQGKNTVANNLAATTAAPSLEIKARTQIPRERRDNGDNANALPDTNDRQPTRPLTKKAASKTPDAADNATAWQSPPTNDRPSSPPGRSTGETRPAAVAATGDIKGTRLKNGPGEPAIASDIVTNPSNNNGPAATNGILNSHALDAPASPTMGIGMVSVSPAMTMDAANSSQANPVLSFLSGRIDLISPEQITDVVINNKFIATAMAAGDIATFYQTPQSTTAMLQAIGISQEQLAMITGSSQASLSPVMTPRQLMNTLDVDAQNVLAELQNLQANLAVDGLKSYVTRAEALQSTRASFKTAIPMRGEQANMALMSDPTDMADLEEAPQVPAALAMAVASQSHTMHLSKPQVLHDALTGSMVVMKDAGRTDTGRLNALSMQAPSEASAMMATTMMIPQTNAMVTPYATAPITFTQAAEDPFASLFAMTRASDIESLIPDVPASQTIPMATANPQVLTPSLSIFAPANLEGKRPILSVMREDDRREDDAIPGMLPLTNRNEALLAAHVMTDRGSPQAPGQTQLIDSRLSADQLIERLTNPFDTGQRDQQSFGDERGGENNGREFTNGPSHQLGLHGPMGTQHAQRAEASAFAHHLNEAPEATRAKISQAVLERANIMLKEGGGSMRIDLGTSDLGHIDLAMEVAGDRIDLRIVASSEEARRVISADMARLREALGANNLNLRHVEVGLSGGNSWSQQQTGGGHSSGQSFEERRIIEEPQRVTQSSRRVDRRVSLSGGPNSTAAALPNQGKIQVLA